MSISLYIVEDYPLSRIGLKHSLAKYDDIEILGDFETAEECLCAMEKRSVDIILMDIGLPRMKGTEATKQIKLLYPEAKILILTSHASDESVLEALMAGANGYCIKDTPAELLVKIIKMVNMGALWLAPQIAYIPAYHLSQINHNKNRKKPQKNITYDLKLTERELSVLHLIVKGKTNTEIAKEISISKHTAKAHVANILSKLNVDDRVQAAVKAVRSGMLQ